MGLFKKKYGVFISYSHEDVNKIVPIIRLIRAMRKDLVFQDIREIDAGEVWQGKLYDALDQARIIIVFWCRHSAKSAFVKKEYEIAIKKKKIIIPLKLDYNDLPEDLSHYQWIDFSYLNFHGEAVLRSPYYKQKFKNSPTYVIASRLLEHLNVRPNPFYKLRWYFTKGRLY